MKNKVLLTIFTILTSTEAAFCMPPTIKSAVVKFSFAMLGVVISSFVIWLGLLIYNKIRENLNESEYSFEDEGLKTPKSKDDAINFYIKKNKLK